MGKAGIFNVSQVAPGAALVHCQAGDVRDASSILCARKTLGRREKVHPTPVLA